jgi:dienelactone hydrolase
MNIYPFAYRSFALCLALLGTVVASPATSAETAQAPLATSAKPLFYNVRLPKPNGPYPLGHDFAVVVDRSRTDPLSPLVEQPRRIPVHFWYPAVATPAPSRCYATDRREAEVLESPEQVGASEFLKTNADEGAPVAKGSFPVLLFSPGFGTPAEFYQVFSEQLASYGYIVAVAHSPGVNGLVTVDGEPFPSLDLPEEKLEEWVALNDLVVADLRSVLAQIKDGRALPTLKLKAALDLTRIGALGHSFGGSAAVRLAGLDSTVRAAVNLDGTIFGGDHLNGLATNALFLKSGGNTEDPSNDLAYAKLKGRGLLVVQGEAGHNTFSDGYFLQRVLLGRGADTLTELFGLNPAANLLVTRQLLVTYFDVELKQHPSAKLTRFLTVNKKRLTAQSKGF